MSDTVSSDDLMRYLDGELSPDEAQRVREALERSTELQRELRIFEALHRDMEGLVDGRLPQRSVWDEVHGRISRPVGWILVSVGALVWLGYGVWVYATSPAAMVEKLAVGALGVGFLVLLLNVILERVRESRTDLYRNIER